MAQWAGQFSGFTHETKVQDVERSLRQAVATFQALPEAERTLKRKAIQHLAERLIAVRLKVLRARISALTEPGRKRLDDAQATLMQKREQELHAQTVEDVLREFGL